MPLGTCRYVIPVGTVALKVPRPRSFSGGLRSNRWEREVWYHWRPRFGWEHICPVLYADPLGLVVVMPRAKQPVTFDDVVEATSHDYYPDVHLEMKPEDYGRLKDRVLALDYGLADAQMIRDRRKYYETFPPNWRDSCSKQPEIR